MEVITLLQIISHRINSLKRGPFGSSLKKDLFVKSRFLVYEQYHALNNDFTFQRYFINEEKFKELENLFNTLRQKEFKGELVS